jgi:5'-nucleotidase
MQDYKKFRIYIDMDRTLVDYDKGFAARRAVQEFPQSKEGFWYNLAPMPGAIESFNYLFDKYDVWILTRPSFHNLNCYTEKAKWVRDNLGFEAQKKTILCGDKSLVKGHYLIDDHHKDGQTEFEGKWIQIGNEKYPDWKSVVEEIDRDVMDKY